MNLPTPEIKAKQMIENVMKLRKYDSVEKAKNDVLESIQIARNSFMYCQYYKPGTPERDTWDYWIQVEIKVNNYV